MDENQDKISVVVVDPGIGDGQSAAPIDPQQIRRQLAKDQITGDDLAAAVAWAHQLIQQNGEADA